MIRPIKSKIINLKNHIIYRGDSRKCPLCGNESKKFLEAGVVPRKDAKCLHCGSLERHRLFFLYLEKNTDFFKTPPQRALHIAPEYIFESKFRPLIGEGYLTADLYDKNVDVKMDITDIQYPDDSFDFIYCSHVLEHVPDDRKAMREFRRVLAPGGIAVILVPVCVEKTIEDPTIEDPKERLRRFGQEDHYRLYGPDYSDRLVEEGFSVTIVHREDFLDPEEIEKMGVTPAAGELYVCEK